MDHPSDSVNEAFLESRPGAGWVPTLLDWGAVPRLISLMDWPNQSDTRPWPGKYAAAGDACFEILPALYKGPRMSPQASAPHGQQILNKTQSIFCMSGGRLLCALAAHENAPAHEQLLRSDAVPVLLHALEEVWLNTCSAEILFYLANRCAASSRSERHQKAILLVHDCCVDATASAP